MTCPRTVSVILVAAVLGVVVSATPRARAAELPVLTAEQVRQVETLVSEAQALQAAGRFVDAALKLKQAVALYPAPEVRYNLGYVYEQGGAFANAREEYTQCQAGGATGELAREAAAGEARMAERLATGTLRLDVSPVGAAVSVDGTPRGTAPIEPLALPSGRHRVRVTADGYAAQEEEAEVVGASTVTLSIALEALRVVGSTVPARGDGIGADVTVSGRSVRPGGERVLGERLFHLSLSLSEGVLASGQAGSRTSVGLELVPAFRWAWFQLDLGLGLGVESPVTFFLRPGVRAFMGPVYVRAAAGFLASDGVTSWGALFGLGGQVPLGRGWFFVMEADASVWPSSGGTFVPIDFVLGAGYGF